jgi:B12-binding domain/radical SAM domain protein
MKRVVNRDQVAYKDPEILAQEVSSIIKYLRGPIFFLGDCLQGGRDRFTEMMNILRPLKIRNEVMVEFFSPPARDVLEEVASTFPRFNVEISPESHDEKVRRAFGRPYENADLEKFIEDAQATGCRRLDLFFMTGLPGQDYDSALGTVDYCRALMADFGSRMRLVPFISPLAPFVDPGSDVFESPDHYGYRLRFRSLEEHRKAMLSHTWTDMLNYETVWMNRDTLAQATYESAIGLSRLKGEKGLFSRKRTEAVVRRARLEMDIMKGLHSLKSLPLAQRKRTAASLKKSMKRSSGASVCQKEELNMPVGAIRIQLLNLVRLLLTGKGA